MPPQASKGISPLFLVFSLVFLLLKADYSYAFCFQEAGAEYGISDELLRQMAKVESGSNPAAVNYNDDGTYDFGLMQINTCWYKDLGYERWMALGNSCYNVKVGAWVLSQCIRKFGYTWEAVGCYNAGFAEKNRGKRTVYAWKVYNALKKAGAKRGNPKSNIHIVMAKSTQGAR